MKTKIRVTEGKCTVVQLVILSSFIYNALEKEKLQQRYLFTKEILQELKEHRQAIVGSSLVELL